MGLLEATNYYLGEEDSVTDRTVVVNHMLLHHGSESKDIKQFKDNVFCNKVDSYLPRNYAENLDGYLYTVELSNAKLLDLRNENRDKQQKTRSGFRVAGTDVDYYNILKNISNGKITEDMFKKYSGTPFSRYWTKENINQKQLFDNVKALGFAGMIVIDESFDLSITDDTYIIFNGNDLTITKVEKC